MTEWNKDDNIRNASYWMSRKIELIELKDYNKKNAITKDAFRGGIFNVELGIGNIGGEKNKKRPCLVISNNILNTGDTIVIIPLSTKYKKRFEKGVEHPKYKNHYILRKSKYPFLDKNSCVKCEDIRNIDKIRLVDHLGNIDTVDLVEIKKRILFALGY